MKDQTQPSAPAQGIATLHILLALSEGELHGYGIMQAVKRQSAEQYKMGPGTLYGNLAKLLDQGLVAEVQRKQMGGESRREYQLTAKGEALLREEVRRLELIVRTAKRSLSRLGEREA